MSEQPQTTADEDDSPLGEPMVFVRAEGFYAVHSVRGLDLREQAGTHAALNPGTLRVEDIHGNALWRLQ